VTSAGGDGGAYAFFSQPAKSASVAPASASHRPACAARLRELDGLKKNIDIVIWNLTLKGAALHACARKRKKKGRNHLGKTLF
jgi:hypothetical protein